MANMMYRELADGVHFRYKQDKRFKTMRVSIHFITPLSSQKAAANALLPFMLIRSSRAYPDYTKLAQHLANLYGASLNANAERHGRNQILSMSISGLADKYALYGENISASLSNLLCDIAFDPYFDENGEFDSVGFEIEKRQTLELIDSEFNDKRLYARIRCMETMLKDELPCVSRFSSREAVEKLSREDLKIAWQELIKNAQIEIMALGNCNPEAIGDVFAEAVQKIARNKTPLFDLSICPTNIKEVKEQKESLPVVQSKLVMGFRTGVAPSDNKIYALRAAVALLGGSPSSKLFANVREKMGLCYYCSASIDRVLGLMMIDSGIAPQNVDAAREAILRQLEDIKAGNFTDWELNAAKLSICDSYRTVEDFISGIESWYLYRLFLPEIKTPFEVSEAIASVTREQVLEVVSQISLDTVFLLEGDETIDDE